MKRLFVTALLLSLLGTNSNVAVNIALTPQRAVLNFACSNSDGIERANVIGDAALVRSTCAEFEGPVRHALILVQRFSFGWQLIRLIDDSCELADRNFDSGSIKALTKGLMVPANRAQECVWVRGFQTDVGSPTDIAAIRALMRNCLTVRVVVVRNYADAAWYGCGGGQAIFQRKDNHWILFAGGGGDRRAHDLMQLGIPRVDACDLMESVARYRGCDPAATDFPGGTRQGGGGVACGETTIDAVLNNGQTIRTPDGKTYEVVARDEHIAVGWLAMDTIDICTDKSITNKSENGETIEIKT